MEPIASQSAATEIMAEFAALTGLFPAERPPRRYLWTDAFAVCNFLGLYSSTGDRRWRQLALELVGQVHTVLGRHRSDDQRIGWISGLDEDQGRLHPTKGGLRIGKEVNERGTGDSPDDQLEWDRDGQYYHYMTKWMHALHQVSRVVGESVYHRWATELAKTVHARFTYRTPSGNQKRMYWKMSIDLSHPLVPSMGHHDPLDGLVTYLQLQTAAAEDFPGSPELDLGREISELIQMCQGKDWVTDDFLGSGELLSSTYKLAQVIGKEGKNVEVIEYVEFLEMLLDASHISLRALAGKKDLHLPPRYRLAFRELGLSIGLHAVEKLKTWIERTPPDFRGKKDLSAAVDDLTRYVPLGDLVGEVWIDPRNRQDDNWLEHRDINMVMLSTSLAPEGYHSLDRFVPFRQGRQ